MVHGRGSVNEADLTLVSEVALSSIPGHLRPIVRELRRNDEVDSSRCEMLCRVSRPTARQYLAALDLLGIGTRAKGRAERNEPDRLRLAQPFRQLGQT